MQKYVLVIKDDNGYPMRIFMYGDNDYFVYQQAKAMYGDRLISEGASHYDAP